MENVTIFAGKSGVIQGTGKLVIKDFLDVMSVYPPEMSVESDEFMVGEFPMSIKIYPNGDTNEDKGSVCAFLVNKSNEDLTVKFQFVTYNAEDKEFVEEFEMTTIPHGDVYGHGIKGLLTHSECEEVYKDRDFTLAAKVEIAGEMTKLVGSNLSSASKKRKFNVLEDVYKRMDMTDFILVLDGEEVVDNNSKLFYTLCAELNARCLATSTFSKLPLQSWRRWWKPS